MASTVFGIDKGVVKAFALMIVIVGGITTLFLSQYISVVILGSVFNTTGSYNGSVWSGKIPVTDDAGVLLSSAEDDYFTTFGYVNTGVKFTAALVTVVAVILVFASFLPKKGRRDKPMDY